MTDLKNTALLFSQSLFYMTIIICHVTPLVWGRCDRCATFTQYTSRKAGTNDSRQTKYSRLVGPKLICPCVCS